MRTLAAEVGLPASTVHAMLVAAKLQLHRIRTFTFGPDPDFEAKLLDIVGLYLNPRERAGALRGREDEDIQALNRTQPGLPLRTKKASRLDQRVRPARHSDVAGCPRDLPLAKWSPMCGTDGPRWTFSVSWTTW